MTVELVLFIVVAAVAIFSAALMLVSRNAVHSALFLVVNLLCVGFFYLMLAAPFLAMVQITVYAGAIVVLFLFVIMLLGSERLGGRPAKYGWVASGAVVLTSAFLIVAFIAILQGNIASLKPIEPAPQGRFVHAIPGAPAVDVYLNDERIVEKAAYGQTTALIALPTGERNVLVYPSCTNEDPAQCPNPITSGSAPIAAVPVRFEAGTTTTYIIGGTAQAPQLISVPTTRAPIEADNTMRLTIVNALPETTVNFVQLNPENPAANKTLAEGLAFGGVSGVVTMPRGAYEFDWNQGERRLVAVRGWRGEAGNHHVFVLMAEEVPVATGEPTTRPVNAHLPPVEAEKAFGGPQRLGEELLSRYLLPFELVALLLLATMVGAIILTREEVIRRERRRLVVSPAIKRINRAVPIDVKAEPVASAVLPEPDRQPEPSGD